MRTVEFKGGRMILGSGTHRGKQEIIIFYFYSMHMLLQFDAVRKQPVGYKYTNLIQHTHIAWRLKIVLKMAVKHFLLKANKFVVLSPNIHFSVHSISCLLNHI